MQKTCSCPEPQTTNSVLGDGTFWCQLCGLEIECEHDLPNAVRTGRASYKCPKCQQDISLLWFFWMDAQQTDQLKDY